MIAGFYQNYHGMFCDVFSNPNLQKKTIYHFNINYNFKLWNKEILTYLGTPYNSSVAEPPNFSNFYIWHKPETGAVYSHSRGGLAHNDSPGRRKRRSVEWKFPLKRFLNEKGDKGWEKRGSWQKEQFSKSFVKDWF